VIYAGADLPAQEIALTAAERGARAVALSLVYAVDPDATAEEVAALRGGLPADTPLLVGGAGVAALPVLAGVVRLEDLKELRAWLRDGAFE
jgi:methylmalonyl-CoA mutase cobalamin-binding subunit